MKETILVLIKFKISGNLRFLSHAETVKVFQRACARTGMKIRHSRGFNPRPKLSLPLPRSVGVESDDDLLCLRVEDSASSFDGEQFKARLCEQLPEDCELLSAKVAEAKALFQPSMAVYVLVVQEGYANEKLKTRIENLLASESFNVQRRINARGDTRNVDVRGFLKSIELNDRNIAVECKISSAGSIRVGEILKLLELDVENLAAPVRRTSVEWN